MRLLLVEDDTLLGDGIHVGLTQEGYTVDWVTDGQHASQALAAETFDLVILDLNLPHRCGLDILRELRARGSKLPVIILTARDTIVDRVQGLDSGGDDYLTKPFDLDELFARVRALLRRSKGRAHPQLVHGNLVIDPAAHTVTLDGIPVDLPPGEFNLLQMLLEEKGRVLSRGQLENSLYGWTKDVDSNTIEVYVHHLRKKLGNDLIRTVRGIGYVIDK